MRKTLSLDLSNSKILPHEFDNISAQIACANAQLSSKSGAGSEFSGWLDTPVAFDKVELARIIKCAEKIKRDSKVLIVIGIGGSYLGARAVIDALNSPLYNDSKKDTPSIYYAGNSISSTYLAKLVDLVRDVDFSVNVISKSGTTTEPAIAFRVFRELLVKKYGSNEAKSRIYATTDKSRGALKQLCDEQGYETFVIPDDVGGRFSVLTAVGLLPICASGVDIHALLDGAAQARDDFSRDGQNMCSQYAAARNILYRRGKTTEILASYEPSLQYLNEWWKQLFGESEGKDTRGIFPASVCFSTDLHSMGQYVQDGMRNIFETVINVQSPQVDMIIEPQGDDADGLNFLSGKSIDFVNKKAFLGTLVAHCDGGVPNIVINLPELSPFYIGYLIYFFEKACAISGYVLGVNPFDQPGVEEYKKNMFALLGKPGFSEQKAILEKRLESMN